MTRQILFPLLAAAIVASCASVRVAAATTSWFETTAFSSDFRYRYERIDQEDKDPYDRHRVRVRVGMKSAINDDVTLGLRLASGSNDPVSTNQTLDGGFTSKAIWIDRAYADYRPAPISGLHLLGGKVPNPFPRPQKSQLIWDSDLNPEGLAAKLSHDAGSIDVFAAGGGFIVDQRKTADDAFLYGAQGGLAYSADAAGLKMVAGVGLFTYTNTKEFGLFVDGEDSFGNSTIEEDGELLYAEGYSLMEAFGEIHVDLGAFPLAVYGDFVSNSKPSEQSAAWLVGVALGKAKEPGTFKLHYNYREVERDAVIGAYCDSDFGGGGTNAKGHAISLGVKLMKNVEAGVTFFANTRNIGPDQEGESYERLQLDFKIKA